MPHTHGCPPTLILCHLVVPMAMVATSWHSNRPESVPWKWTPSASLKTLYWKLLENGIFALKKLENGIFPDFPDLNFQKNRLQQATSGFLTVTKNFRKIRLRRAKIYNKNGLKKKLNTANCTWKSRKISLKTLKSNTKMTFKPAQ